MSGSFGVQNYELRKLGFLEVIENEMVRIWVKILAKSDGKTAGFVGLFSVLAARCW
ncbi:MAG: hypothetical protein ACO1QS_12340 [Verrucomicrobiota bacterium]